MLLENAGQAVTKEELIKYVWPDSFVEEGNLNRNMSTLRKALDEKPSDHRYIETIPKTGYRFIAPVRSLDYQPPTGVQRMASISPRRRVVGRDYEREMLRKAFEQAELGHGNVVSITGDVGIGKTALSEAFIDDLVRDGKSFHLAQGRCSESFTEGEPFVPWIESLSPLVEEPAIGALMAKTAPAWHREISRSSSGFPRRMKRELLDFCKQSSQVHPIIFVLDDFHWADIGSVDLLGFLASRLEQSRVLVVLCYRPVEMKIKDHPFLRLRPDLLSRGACREIELARLSRKDVETYVEMEQPDAFPSDYKERIYAKSEGNPLFVRELMRDLSGLSESVRHLIDAKLYRLEDTYRQLLVTASVQGREFDSAVLASTTQMESQDVEDALQELDQTHGLITRIREEELPDGKFTVRYRFVYALYQEACYASLAPTRKAALSSKLAEAFLTFYGGN
jgi:predicted ATPase